MSDILISIGVEPDLAGHKENARRQINTRQEAMDSLLSIAGRLLIRENEPYMVRDGCLIHRALEILKEGEPTSTVKIETIDEVKARFDRKLAPFLPPPGNAHDRWMVETPEYKADASSVVGSLSQPPARAAELRASP
jgi:hypothetical protein